MITVFKKIGMNVVVPQGTYFIMVDWSPLGELIMTNDKIEY